MERVINTTASLAGTPDNLEAGEENASDVNSAPGAIDEDGELDNNDPAEVSLRNPDGTINPPNFVGDEGSEEKVFPGNEDHTQRIYSMRTEHLSGSEDISLTIKYAAAHGIQNKCRIFKGPVTAYVIASALIDIDQW